MKKIFLLLTSLALFASSAMAQTQAIYDFNVGTGSTDGTTGAPSAFTAQTSFKLGVNSQYIVITPVTGESFKNGDEVEVTGFCGSAGKDMGLYLATSADGRTSGTAVYTAAATKNQSYTATGTLTLTADASTLYLFRYASTPTTITEVKISHSSTPAIKASDASIACKNDGVAVTTDVSVSGGNLTGTTLTATLSPAVDGLSVALSNSAIVDGAITTTATLTYSSIAAAQGTTTLTLSDGTTDKAVTITYACYALVEQTEVTDSTTWDFSQLGVTEVKLTATTVPAKSSDWLLLANFNALKDATLPAISPAATFDAQALMWLGEYIVRAGEYTQVDSIKLKTTRPGKFVVTFANTGNKAEAAANYIYVKINDVVSAVGSITTAMMTVTLENIPAGDVTITGVKTDGAAYTHAGLRIAKIAFVPHVTLDESTVTKDALATLKDAAATTDVTIQRTLYKDGGYNTICLPFSLSATELAASPLAGYSKLQELSDASVKNKGAENETIDFTMSDATSIEAGKPYVIAWESGDNIVNPKFTSATITVDEAEVSTEYNGVKFCGTLVPMSVTASDKSIVFVGTDGKILWPSESGTIRGFRCYFKIDSGD